MHSKAIVKHPLNEQWTMWYLKQDQKKKWEEMLDRVHSFDMVEDFWSIYNHIRAPSELNQGDDYSMFKNNIRPMWEDAANKNGGRWLLNVDKQYRRSKLDDFWLDTVSFSKRNISENVQLIKNSVKFAAVMHNGRTFRVSWRHKWSSRKCPVRWR